MQKKSFPWSAVVVVFIFFFPVGTWMLIKKMKEEPFRYIQNGKTATIFGLVLWGMMLFYITGVIAGVEGAALATTVNGETVEISPIYTVIMALLLFGTFGALCFCTGVHYIKKGKKYKKYVFIVTSGREYAIDHIAAAYPTTYENAISDLQAMIDDGYFANATIDLRNRELVIPKREMECPNCGATNLIAIGEAARCEYCQSQLSEE